MALSLPLSTKRIAVGTFNQQSPVAMPAAMSVLAYARGDAPSEP
jgi:hypothetical protein